MGDPVFFLKKEKSELFWLFVWREKGGGEERGIAGKKQMDKKKTLKKEMCIEKGAQKKKERKSHTKNPSLNKKRARTSKHIP